MSLKKNWIAYCGLTRKETTRWLRIWPQTFLPPVITSILYFLIFGHIIGGRIGAMNNVPYIVFIAPGLIMMTVMTNSYANVASSFFGARFSRNIEEMLISSMPSWLIITGYVTAGALRGTVTGILVFIVAAFFTGIHLAHPVQVIISMFLCASLFSLAGLLNGIFAKKFDDTMLIVTFILTPLIYLGGVFYDLSALPTFWQRLSLFNPIHYVIALFRDTMIHVGNYNTYILMSVLLVFIIGLFSLCWYLVAKGYRIKT